MAINLKFIHKDDSKRYAHDKSLPLVNFILSHIDFLPYLCNCITTYTEVGCLDRVNDNGKNLFSRYIELLDFDNEENYDHIKEFEEIFRNTYNVKDIAENIRGKTLANIRGKILEDLLERFVRPRYTDRSNPFKKKFDTGCEIVLNGKNLSLANRKTVDIAGWDGVSGEFYEAKVNPDRIDENVLSLLTLIKNNLDNLKIQAIVGCVSMKNTETMITCIEKVKDKVDIEYNNNIKMFGKNDLLEIKEGPLAMPA